jgi:TonB family protein
MTSRADCVRAETLAGAIALGEARDSERDAYRRHLATCGRCVSILGGEREIERVIGSAVAARDAERWEPELQNWLARRRNRRVGSIVFAGAGAAALLALGIGLSRMHAPATTHSIVVVHNVINLTRPAQPSPTQEERAIAAFNTQTGPKREQQAESLVVGAATPLAHDPAPLGGESAIVPHPSARAYDQHAEGTTAFEVRVDRRGMPTRCTITKSSGFGLLDQAVCRAAMQARYSPRIVDGRTTSGFYRDAFTFRSGDRD